MRSEEVRLERLPRLLAPRFFRSSAGFGKLLRQAGEQANRPRGARVIYTGAASGGGGGGGAANDFFLRFGIDGIRDGYTTRAVGVGSGERALWYRLRPLVRSMHSRVCAARGDEEGDDDAEEDAEGE